MKKLLSTFIIASLSLLAIAQQNTTQCNSYYRLSAGFSGMQMYSDADDTKFDTDLFSPGGTVGFAYGNILSGKDSPNGALYMEIGADLTFNTGSHVTDEDTKYEVKTRTNIMSASIPFDLCYKIPINTDNDYFFIYGGLCPKANLMANMKIRTASEKATGAIIVGGHNVGAIKELVKHEKTIDMFSGEDMGEGFTAERFQFGANAGLGFEFGKIALSYKFNVDLVPFQDYTFQKLNVKTLTMSHSISVSYIFRNW